MSTNQPTKKLSTPGYVSMNIKDTNEKALQRALLMQGTSLLDGKEVKWLDIELPIEFTDNSRRKCVDLIGKDNDGQLYLCEFKSAIALSRQLPLRDILCIMPCSLSLVR